jgi:hypothetical protein
MWELPTCATTDILEHVEKYMSTINKSSTVVSFLAENVGLEGTLLCLCLSFSLYIRLYLSISVLSIMFVMKRIRSASYLDDYLRLNGVHYEMASPPV